MKAWQWKFNRKRRVFFFPRIRNEWPEYLISRQTVYRKWNSVLTCRFLKSGFNNYSPKGTLMYCTLNLSRIWSQCTHLSVVTRRLHTLFMLILQFYCTYTTKLCGHLKITPTCGCWTCNSKPMAAITASTLLWRLSTRIWLHGFALI